MQERAHRQHQERCGSHQRAGRTTAAYHATFDGFGTTYLFSRRHRRALRTREETAAEAGELDTLLGSLMGCSRANTVPSGRGAPKVSPQRRVCFYAGARLVEFPAAARTRHASTW